MQQGQVFFFFKSAESIRGCFFLCILDFWESLALLDFNVICYVLHGPCFVWNCDSAICMFPQRF
jgi:hypothetical protein